jgi:hypothetical protein
MSNLSIFEKPEKKVKYKVLNIVAGSQGSGDYADLAALLNDDWEIVEVIIVDGVEDLHHAETTFILYKA